MLMSLLSYDYTVEMSQPVWNRLWLDQVGEAA